MAAHGRTQPAGAEHVLLAAIQQVDASMLSGLDSDQRAAFHEALAQMLG